MNELANTSTENLISLDDLAEQARFCVQCIGSNLFNLGRILIQAKKQVDHGAWEAWINDNAGGMSLRVAEDLMAACERFDGRQQFMEIGKSKLFKLLALPAGTEEAFLEAHDVEAMTVREVQEAVKKARAEALAEARAEISREREARFEAERRAEALESRPYEMPDDVADELRAQRDRIQEAEESAQHFAQLARDVGNAKAALERENRSLQSEIDEMNADMQEQQRAYDEQQKELFALRNAQKQGGADRVPADELTYEVFSAAVREFLGLCASMPFMKGTFSAMPHAEKQRYDILLKSVEGWTEGSRRALESCAVEGGIIVE
ncbi:MAG: DUF3102 domain-containing protein [Clostridia bacterium]|nr:DUF3102 domain-containing protein [Clostridia bacterium]